MSARTLSLLLLVTCLLIQTWNVDGIPMFGGGPNAEEGKTTKEDKQEPPQVVISPNSEEEILEDHDDFEGAADDQKLEAENGGEEAETGDGTKRYFHETDREHIAEMQAIADPNEKAMEEEAENFKQFDVNHDTFVDLDEWLSKLHPPASDESHPGSEDTRWGKEFKAADQDGDGKLAWTEWVAMLFHEDPQAPRYVDGHDPDALPPDAEYIMLAAFDEEDQDNDGQLSPAELLRVLIAADKKHRAAAAREMGNEAPGEEEDPMGMEDINELAPQVMKDLDKDKSGSISAQEWLMMGKPEPA